MTIHIFESYFSAFPENFINLSTIFFVARPTVKLTTPTVKGLGVPATDSKNHAAITRNGDKTSFREAPPIVSHINCCRVVRGGLSGSNLLRLCSDLNAAL